MSEILKPRHLVLERPDFRRRRRRIAMEMFDCRRAEYIGLNTGEPALALRSSIIKAPLRIGMRQANAVIPWRVFQFIQDRAPGYGFIYLFCAM
jgi:hypothetical protein